MAAVIVCNIHRSTAKIIVRVLALFSCLCVCSAQAYAVDLTEAERQYVRDAGIITFCVDPDWAPYEIINDRGLHEGIAADLLHLAASRAGLQLRLVKTATWEESIEASKAGRCELLSFLNQTPARDQWLVFTDPIFIDPNVIVTREEHPFVASAADLYDETVVLPNGTSVEERIRRDFPNLAITTTGSEAEAFAMVSSRKADMTVRSMIVSVYTIKKEGWFNLKISGQIPGYENLLRIGVRRQNTVLRDILNKSIASITSTERRQIANRHVSINVQSAVDYELIKKIVLVFSVILLTNSFWIIKLKKANDRLRVRSRTDDLTALPNRADLNDRFTREIERARRYNRPLSVILLDIDHFKRTNDEFGHLMGDKVLVAFARVLTETTRGLDTVGRWGGEEFLVLCPETAGAQAMLLAQRICHAVREHAFESGCCHTVSAGVAALKGGDTIDSLLHRADEALYRAKEGGRDQACLLESAEAVA